MIHFTVYSWVISFALELTKFCAPPQAEAEQQQWLLGAAGGLGWFEQRTRRFGLWEPRSLHRRGEPVRGGLFPAEAPRLTLQTGSFHRPARSDSAHWHQLHLPAPFSPVHPTQRRLWLRQSGGAGVHRARAAIAVQLPLCLLCVFIAVLSCSASEETQRWRWRRGLQSGERLRIRDSGGCRLGELCVGHGAERKPDSCWEEQWQTGSRSKTSLSIS